MMAVAVVLQLVRQQLVNLHASTDESRSETACTDVSAVCGYCSNLKSVFFMTEFDCWLFNLLDHDMWLPCKTLLP